MLPALQYHPVSRRYTSSDSPVISLTLHAFSDASVKGYGGAVCLRLLHQDATISISVQGSPSEGYDLDWSCLPLSWLPSWYTWWLQISASHWTLSMDVQILGVDSAGRSSSLIEFPRYNQHPTGTMCQLQATLQTYLQGELIQRHS